MKLPTRVTECEVGTRDGFQIESGANIRLSRGDRPAGRVAAAQVLLSFVMLASFASPAGGDSTVPRQRERSPANANQLAQSADGQQQFDEGQAAFNRGNYAAALRSWTPLAVAAASGAARQATRCVGRDQEVDVLAGGTREVESCGRGSDAHRGSCTECPRSIIW